MKRGVQSESKEDGTIRDECIICIETGRGGEVCEVRSFEDSVETGADNREGLDDRPVRTHCSTHTHTHTGVSINLSPECVSY